MTRYRHNESGPPKQGPAPHYRKRHRTAFPWWTLALAAAGGLAFLLTRPFPSPLWVGACLVGVAAGVARGAELGRERQIRKRARRRGGYIR